MPKSLSGTLRQSLGPKRAASSVRFDFAKEILNKSVPRDSVDDCEVLLTQVNVATAKLNDSVIAFEKIDMKWQQLISDIDDDEQLAEEEKLYEKHAAHPNDGYLIWMEAMRNVKLDLEARKQFVERLIISLNARVQPQTSSQPDRPLSNEPRVIQAKLPKLTLPVFDGSDPTNWKQFWTIFQSNVDNQPIANTEKFTYLIGQLKGTALETIKGLSINDQNYDVATNLLRQRFEKSTVYLIGKLYSQLKQLLCSSKVTSSIRSTYNMCESILRQLEDTGEQLDSNTSLSIDVLSKYPAVVIRDLGRYHQINEGATVSDIRKATEKYVNEAECLSERISYLSMLTPLEGKSKSGSQESDSPRSKPSNNSALFSGDAKPAGKPKSVSGSRGEPAKTSKWNTQIGKCFFCDGDHYNTECPNYATAEDGISQLRKRNRCIRCGRLNHHSKDCKKNVRCVICQTDYHYTALCKEKFPSESTTMTVVSSGGKSKSKDNPKAPAEPKLKNPSASQASRDEPADVTILNVTEKSALLTATTTVVNEDTGRSIKARLIFDTASQRSYITKEAMDDLKLRPLNSQKLHVSVFGSKKTRTVTANVVSFGIIQKDGSTKTIVAHSTPVVTGKSIRLPDRLSEQDNSLLHSMKYALADDIDDPKGTVDILVGSEYFWEFINGCRMQTPTDLLFIPSTVGLLLGGRYRCEAIEDSSDSESTALLCLTETALITPSSIERIATESKIQPNHPNIDDYTALDKIGIADDPVECDNDKAVAQDNESAVLAELPTKYQEASDTQIKKGVIERVSSEEVSNPKHTAHSLPHQPVVKFSSAATKARNTTFHHVRSEDNPADYYKVREMEQEYRSAPICHSFVVGSCDAPEFEKFLGIDITRFSTLQKLLRVSVLVGKVLKKRVWEKLSDRTKAKYPKISKTLDKMESTNSQSTASEIRTMKDSRVKATLDLHYTDVFEAIKTKKKHHLVQQLGLMVDENEILRSHSRFDHADMPFDVRCPKLMPKTSRLCELIIMDVHRKLLHSGVSHTLSQVRREFWVPQGRAAIKRILNKCVICRTHHGPSFSLPMMPPWPRERMVQQAPFQSTGLDYVGPMSTKVGDSVHKMWICLFACLVTRAIHLEVVTDCTAKEFLNCLIRLVSRRGTPQLLISDNAPQFRTTKTVLDRAWHRVMTDETVRTFSSDRGIEWRFTIELAPWQGGFYERLVQVVKRTLKVAIGRRLLAWQEIVTLVTEVEAIANTRPITYIFEDHNSKMRSIRLVDFLTDLLVSDPDIEESSIDSSSMGEATKRLVAFWKYRRKQQQKIWDLWYDEYLLSLRERGQSKHRPHRPEVQSHPRPNEIVVLRDDDHPRGMWKLAKVLRIVPSSDGQIRAVELELPNREVIRRTINFLYPLEMEAEAEIDNEAAANNAAPDDSNDADGFFGFSPEDVQRTIANIRRYDDLENDDEEFTLLNVTKSIRKRQTAECALILLSGLSSSLASHKH